MKKFLIIILIFIVAAGFVFGSTACAAGLVPCGGPGDIYKDCELCHFIMMIKNIMDFLVNTSFIVVSLMVAVGGIMYLTAGGGSRIETAKKTITGALIGFVIIISSWLIVNSILLAMGYNQANVGIRSVGNQFIIECD